MPLTRGRSIRFGGYLHRDSIGAAPSGAAPNFSAQLRIEPDVPGLPLRPGHPQIECSADAAGANLEPEHPLAELRPLPEQQLPAAGGAADAKLVDAHAREGCAASQAGVVVGVRA